MKLEITMSKTDMHSFIACIGGAFQYNDKGSFDYSIRWLNQIVNQEPWRVSLLRKDGASCSPQQFFASGTHSGTQSKAPIRPVFGQRKQLRASHLRKHGEEER